MTNSLTRLINLLLLAILFLTSTTSIIVSNTVIKDNNLIYIDPGHGGPDGGATGIDGLYEKDIVLSVSLKLKKYLTEAGYNVKLTRTGDYDLASDGSKNRKREDIYKRVDLINESNCLLYISIHANKYPSTQVYGAQVFYNKHTLKSKELADEVQEVIKAILQNTKRIAKSISGKYLIDKVTALGCMVEIGFLSNPTEAKLLKDIFYQEKMAYAIFLGICSFLEKN